MIAVLLLVALRVQDPWPILDRASRTYDSVRTLAADFVQVVDNPMLGGPDTTRGRLFQRRPNHFAMRFTDPAGDRIVADGRYLWLYTPSSTPGQVIRSAIPATGTSGPNLIGQFVERPRERYDARYLRTDSSAAGVADAIVLTPKSGDLPYTEATIYVSRSDGLVRRVEIAETSGQRRTVMLQDAVVNGDIPWAEFRFAPPGGSRVVDQ
ncbi:MAG: outer membrane lipoprotein chaperone LolA [Gemmatimonadales bacterium]|nr:outer membrane lipoprotein chaperone LolA [Gemmatimonadales bacterium]